VIANRIDPAAVPPHHRSNASVFIADAAVTLRRALVARHGLERGCEAAAEAVAWAWEHLNDLETMANPIGYLYRVAQSSLRRGYRIDRLRVDLLPDGVIHDAHHVDHDLFDALRRLTPDQRVAVVMVHMYGFTYRDVAGLVGTSEAAVTNYVHRGMTRLRTLLDRKDLS